jgi:hypothetical protein
VSLDAQIGFGDGPLDHAREAGRAPRSDTDTKGDDGPSRLCRRSSRISRPLKGCVADVPFLALRMCRVAVLWSTCSQPIEQLGCSTTMRWVGVRYILRRMTSRFGVELHPKDVRWAAAERVSQDVIAAVLLLHERSVDEIAPQLSAAELEQTIVLVGRSPRLYARGTLEALESRRATPQAPPGEIERDRQWTGASASASRSLTFLCGYSCFSCKQARSAFTKTQYSAAAIPSISTT